MCDDWRAEHYRIQLSVRGQPRSPSIRRDSVEDDLERLRLRDELRAAGLPVIDISDNDLAKNHIKHMVGGRNADLQSERIFQFSFPERRGALRRFLDVFGINWNISLFHYRSQGGNVARVLAGIQVPQDTSTQFDNFLNALDYEVIEVSDDPACRLFL